MGDQNHDAIRIKKSKGEEDGLRNVKFLYSRV